MSPLIALLVFQSPLPFAEVQLKDAGLVWRFDGTSKASPGRYELVGKGLRGEVNWFVAPKGHFDMEALYKSDTLRTKEADATKGFSHVRTLTVFAGIAAIQSDQKYTWREAAVASRCIYATKGNRAWVIRLWWPQGSMLGLAKADQFLANCRLLP